jgi:hypothetical protein
LGQAVAPPLACVVPFLPAEKRMAHGADISRGVLLPPLALGPSPFVAWAANHSDANRLPRHPPLPPRPFLPARAVAPRPSSAIDFSCTPANVNLQHPIHATL